MCDNEQTCGCLRHPTNRSVQQTLEELDFSRGIWTAALDGSFDDVLCCLEKKKIPVDQCDTSGFTALHYASRNGHASICKLLLDNNASPNIQTRSGGVTPLHRAAYCGHADITELLLRYGANALIADSDGKLPLHKSFKTGHPILGCIDKGQLDNATHQISTLQDNIFKEQSFQDKLQEIQSGHKFASIQTGMGGCILLIVISMAAENGHKSVIEILVKAAQSSVSHKDNRGQTPKDCVPKDHVDEKILLES